MVRPLGKDLKPEYGLEPPAATVTISTRPQNGDPKEYVLLIGAQDSATKNYAVKFSESPYYVHVPEFSVQDVLTSDVAAFAATPTPVPAASTPTAPTLTPQS